MSMAEALFNAIVGLNLGIPPGHGSGYEHKIVRIASSDITCYKR